MTVGGAELLAGLITAAFQAAPYPGHAFLQGSFDGCEPADEIAHFKGHAHWAELEPAFLDARYCALSFFSEAGFRFYLPAYLTADIRRQLRTADPAFHLTHGFSDRSYEERREAEPWCPAGEAPTSSIRGAMGRSRGRTMPAEEAAAIVAYLRWRQRAEQVTDENESRGIDAALTGFWLERARSAPTVADLAARLY